MSFISKILRGHAAGPPRLRSGVYMAQMDSVKELWIETGVVSRATDLRRFIPVHDIICRSHSPVFIKILPAIHGLTGCDSTSAFFGIGKKSVYTIVTDKGAHCFEDLLFLGRQDEAVGIAAARKFIACLYDPKGKEISAHISMDILRAKFAAKRDSSLAKLPPCEDSIKQHIRRASWQVRIWISSHIPKPDLGSPLHHGWRKEENRLVPVYFEGVSASELLQDLLCTCSVISHCTAASCVCRQNNLPCVELCSCKGEENCGNPLTGHAASDSDSD